MEDNKLNELNIIKGWFRSSKKLKYDELKSFFKIERYKLGF